MQNMRLILYHKQPTSARILFCRRQGTICHFDGLPTDAKVITNNSGESQLVPESLTIEVEQQLQLSQGSLELERDFQAVVKKDTETINVYLAQFTQIDAPHEQVAEMEGKLISITEARALSDLELRLLGLAYTFLMDG